MASGQVAGNLVVNIGADLSGLNSGLATASGSLSRFGSGMALAGAAVAGGFAAGMATGVKSAGDLEQAVANISTIKPSIDTKQVFNQLNELSTKVPQSSKQLADAMYNVFSSVDVSQAQALQLVQQFAEGAVGAQTDAATFGQSIVGVMNAYGIAAEDAGHISDVFFNTVNQGVVSGEELASSLGPVTQSAKAAGVSLDELGSMIVGVTKEGGPAAQNINNLNNFLQKVTTTKAQDALNAMGIATKTATGEFRPTIDVLSDLKTNLAGMTEAGRANALQEIFPDAQARQGAATLISQLDAVKSALDTNVNSTGSAARAFATMSATFNSQLTLLGNNVKAVLTSMGAAVLPILTPMISALAVAIPGAFAKASDAASKLAPAFESAGRGVSNLAMVLTGGISVSELQQITEEKLEQAFSGAAAAIVPAAQSAGQSIAAALANGIRSAPDIKSSADQAASDFISSFGAKIASAPAIKLPAIAGGGDTSGATEGIGKSLEAASGPLGEFSTTFAGILAVLVTATPLFAGIASAIAAFGGIASVVGGIIAGGLLAPVVLIAAAVAALYVAWSNNFLGIQDTVNAVIPVVLAAIQGLPDTINGIITALTPTFEQFSAAFSEGFAAAGPALAQVGEALGAFAEQVGPVLGQMLPDFQAIYPLVQQLAAAVLNLVQVAFAQLPGILAAVGPLLQSLGNVIVAVAPAIGGILTFAISALVTSLTFLVNFISAALPTAQAVVVGVVNVMTAIFNGLAQVITAVVATVQAVFAGDWAGAWNGAQAVAVAVMNMVQSVSAAVFAAVLGIIAGFLTSTQSIWGPAWTAIQTTVQTILTTIQTFVQTQLDSISNTISTALTTIQNGWDTGWNALTGLLTTAWNAITNVLNSQITGIQNAITTGMSTLQTNWTTAWNKLPEPVTTAFNTVVSTIGNYVGQVQSAAYNVGAAAVQGLVNGINALIGQAEAAAQRLAETVSKVVNLHFITGSPSRLFYDIGTNVGLGLVNGLDASVPGVADAAANMADAVTGGGSWGNVAAVVAEAVANGARGDATGSSNPTDASASDSAGIGSLGPDLVQPMVDAWDAITTTINTAIANLVAINTPLLDALLGTWLNMFARIRTDGTLTFNTLLNLLATPWSNAWNNATKVVETAGLRIIKIVDEVARHIQRLLQLIARLPGGTPAPNIDLGKPIGGNYDTDGFGSSDSRSASNVNNFNVNVQNADVDADQLFRLLERQMRLAGGVV